MRADAILHPDLDLDPVLSTSTACARWHGRVYAHAYMARIYQQTIDLFEVSRTSECIEYYGAHLISIPGLDCVHSILMTLYHMCDILSSYWGCGKFFIH